MVWRDTIAANLAIELIPGMVRWSFPHLISEFRSEFRGSCKILFAPNITLVLPTTMDCIGGSVNRPFVCLYRMHSTP